MGIFVDYNTLAIILVIVALDIFIRWIAFKRVDSVAIEISIISLLFNFFRFITDAYVEKYAHEWVIRLAIGIVTLGALITVHAVYFEKLREIIKKEIEEGLGTQKDYIVADGDKLAKLTRHSIFLTFVAFFNGTRLHIRKGKTDTREATVYLLKRLYKKTLPNNSFVLPRLNQIIGLGIFFVGGIVSISLTVVRFI